MGHFQCSCRKHYSTVSKRSLLVSKLESLQVNKLKSCVAVRFQAQSNLTAKAFNRIFHCAANRRMRSVISFARRLETDPIVNLFSSLLH